jgi:hypothetical protein
MLCQAPDLETALDWAASQSRANFIEWQDLVIENEEPAQVMEDSINSSQKIIDQAKTGREA